MLVLEIGDHFFNTSDITHQINEKVDNLIQIINFLINLGAGIVDNKPNGGLDGRRLQSSDRGLRGR